MQTARAQRSLLFFRQAMPIPLTPTFAFNSAPWSRPSRWPPTLPALGLFALLAACGQGSAPAAGPGGSGAARPPPVEVGVVTVRPGDVGLITELPGRLEASRVAQVRARAAGILQKRLFREGSDVKAGQLLFNIDAAPYAAAVASAKAGQSRAEANLA